MAHKPAAAKDDLPLDIAGEGENTRIEVDRDEGLHGSRDTGSEAVSQRSTTPTLSLSSSVFFFTYANGRRYHSDRFRTQYFLPNDEPEQDRLDLYHHIFLLLLDGELYTAPIGKPKNVLDVGTGTGIWAVEFADEHPQAEIIGPDISPIQTSWVPPNVKFEVDDMEEPWTYPDNHFDYIHMRSMSGSFRDWAEVLQQAYDKLAPGGYFEFQDYGFMPYLASGEPLTGIHDGHPLTVYVSNVIRAGAMLGYPLDVGRQLPDLLRSAGFVDITTRTEIWPIGTWPKDQKLKEIGRWAKVGSDESAYPFAVGLLTRVGWTMEQVTALCEEVKMGYTKAEYYFEGWFVYGRKPEATEDKRD